VTFKRGLKRALKPGKWGGVRVTEEMIDVLVETPGRLLWKKRKR
jgi:hypothetical protein